MKCKQCNSTLIINKQGHLSCPTCAHTKKTLTVVSNIFNDLKYYTVKSSLNVVTDKLIVQEELDTLVSNGVEVKII
jgi:uncharacterized Zn finger protein (UPF0148 family)